METNKQTNKKTIHRINQTRSLFFEKINKIEKLLTRLTRGHGDSIQINKIRNEKEDITKDTEKIQKIIRSYYKSLYPVKLKNLDQTDRYQIPKLNQDQINHLNSPITPKEIEAVLKSLPTKNS